MRLLAKNAESKFGPLTFIVCAFLFSTPGAFAQSPPKESASSTVFDTVTHWLTVLGEKTENILAPRFGHIGDVGKSPWDGLTARTREIEESKPVRPTSTVSITRDIGEGLVRVATSDDPVVRVRVKATVGAEQAEAAQELAEQVKLQLDSPPSMERVDIKVTGPSPQEKTKSAIKLDYEISVPAGASVVCKNEWGDTEISGVTGTVEIDSRFGAIDLRNIGGAVRARAWGEFPLRASQLRQGGTFELQGTQSEFANVSGALKISNFMGSVAVRELPAETELDVTSESGPIELWIPENATPEISASAAFGSVASDVQLDQSKRGDLVIARGGAAGSKQRLSLHASFNTIAIHREGVKPQEPAQTREGGEFVRKNIEQTLEIPQGAEIAIKAAVGDVRITASDSSQVVVRAALVVQMQTNANAQAAIEALNVQTQLVDGRAMLTTAVRDNMAALGCTRYRIDLDIMCPRGSPVKLIADSGFTTVSSMGAAVSVEQGKGSVTIDQCKRDAGELLASIQEGDVTVNDCAGPLTATTQQGSVKTTAVTDKQVLRATRGRITVESPKGALDAKCVSGDVIALAIDGVLGDYALNAEQGDINLLVPDTADATLFATATNGQVNSKVRLSGSVQGDKREFSGPIGAGKFRVDLGVVGGVINID
ncbi:MAG: DUF4097 family beta strand repeat protein [Candidatus Hydrogenedentes bacterium]|nr:DUF4097 family beta strand repeat protein [Candidatus Hydrogenedentota bacterium]